MRSFSTRSAGLAALLGIALFGQPTFAQASKQTLTDSVKVTADRPQADEKLPSVFIDSRPIMAYLDDQIMPDTVRGLLEELKRPDRCGEKPKLASEEACALVIYKLDDELAPDRLRPPFVMRAIYRITEPENLADTVILMPNGKGELQRYTDGDLFEPLRDIRANICLQDKRMANECKSSSSKGVLYRPYGILGKLENDREGVIPIKSAHRHFFLNLKPPNAEELKQQQIRDLCTQKQGGKPLLVC